MVKLNCITIISDNEYRISIQEKKELPELILGLKSEPCITWQLHTGTRLIPQD
jgi:hypothetical protein